MVIDKTNMTKYHKGFSLYDESGIIRTTEDFSLEKDYTKQRCKKKNKKFFASLDPGVRKFQTIYSEDECIQLGKKASSHVEHLLFRLGKAISNKNQNKKFTKGIAS